MDRGRVIRRDVAAVYQDDTVQKAALIMRALDIGAVPVFDRARRLVGIITDRDIVVRLCARNAPADTTPVSEVMSRDLTVGQRLRRAARVA